MIKYFCLKYGWITWALLLALITLLFWFAFMPDATLTRFFSSDALYLPALYRDFFEDGYTLDGWRLNQAANFFPDMAFFFLLNAIFSDFLVATFWFSMIQYFFIILFMYLIFRELKPTLKLSTFAPAILFFASFMFIVFIDGRFWMSTLLVCNSFHNSAFTMGLVSVYLFLKYLNTKAWKPLIILLVLSMLSGACDKVYFVCFTIPVSFVVVILYFLKFEWKTLTKFLITAVSGAILAIALWIFFKNNPYFSLTKAYGAFTSSHIQSSWAVFSQQMYEYFTDFSFMMVLSWLIAMTYIAIGIHVVIKICKLWKKKEPVNNMFVYDLFVLFFTPIVFFTPILAGSYDNIASIRYNYFPYILLPFSFVVFISDWLNDNRLFRILINFTLSFLMAGYLFIHFPVQEFGKGMKRYFTFYPEKAQIIDSYFDDDKTYKYGVTDDYWTARHVTMFSKKGVRLYRVHDNGEPSRHVANKHWFTDNDKGKHAHCEFTFLLWKKEKEVPDFFLENSITPPVELKEWYLYQIAPYRFIDPGYRFAIDPILIDKSSNTSNINQ